MLVPISWLREYVDINMNTQEFADGMIMSGSNIETVTAFCEDIKNVVVGRIISVRDHEDSDHLLIVNVDVGDPEPLQIVTGATNVEKGQYVPVALDGSILAGGIKIKKGKLRGVQSNGMLCSFSELGFEDKVIPVKYKDGIWILNGEYDPGADLVEALGLRETVVDFEITPNRPDCLSIIGIAREAAATFESDLRNPDTGTKDTVGTAAEDYIAVQIKKPDLCRRYVARVAKDIKIEESPWWLQKRLMFAGMRPINNIVDITNYVLLETGHPIHAFDIRTIEKNQIIVDTAGDGEKFTTLDESERILTDDMLMINDGVGPIAIAGVMGGLNSEIRDDTDTIVVESANFDMDSVRITSKKLGLRTEASSRFEKGMDSNLSLIAADRVCSLISLINAGVVVGGAVDNYPTKIKPKTIEVRVGKINSVLGTDLSSGDMSGIFRRLEMKVADGSDDIIRVTPPTIRMDLNEEIDFSEEVARIYGYNNLKVTGHKDNCEAGMPADRMLRDLIRSTMTGIGYKEIQTYSFVSPVGVESINTPTDSCKRDFVKLINPLGEENSVMRTTLLPAMMEVMERNYKRNIRDFNAFEIGNTFFNKNDMELPDERYSFSIGSYGNDRDFFSLKGAVINILDILGIEEYDFEAFSESGTYHPGICAVLKVNGEKTGIFGEIHPDVRGVYGIDEKVYAGEIDLKSLLDHADIMRYYRPLPKYPFINLDISLLVKDDITVKAIEDIAVGATGDLLESITLFDKYKGKQIPEGMKSLSFSLIYRSGERTLTDEEVMPVHQKLLDKLDKDLGAVLRDV